MIAQLPHSKISTINLRIIPQGTLDNNLEPDSLAGPKALDPNHCRQPTLRLNDLRLEVLTVHDTELSRFWAKALPLLILTYWLSRIWHSRIRITFNIFIYDAVWAKHGTHHLPDAELIRWWVYNQIEYFNLCLYYWLLSAKFDNNYKVKPWNSNKNKKLCTWVA